jgi:hypothetical protein
VLSHIDYTMQYGEDEEPKEVCYLLKISVHAILVWLLRHSKLYVQHVHIKFLAEPDLLFVSFML